MGAALKHKGEPEDDLRGEGGVHAADPTPTQDLVYHVQDVDPLLTQTERHTGGGAPKYTNVSEKQFKHNYTIKDENDKIQTKQKHTNIHVYW